MLLKKKEKGESIKNRESQMHFCLNRNFGMSVKTELL